MQKPLIGPKLLHRLVILHAVITFIILALSAYSLFGSNAESSRSISSQEFVQSTAYEGEY